MAKIFSAYVYSNFHNNTVINKEKAEYTFYDLLRFAEKAEAAAAYNYIMRLMKRLKVQLRGVKNEYI